MAMAMARLHVLSRLIRTPLLPPRSTSPPILRYSPPYPPSSSSKVRFLLWRSFCSPESQKSTSRFGVARFYLQMLEKHPVLTKSVTAASIYTVADVSSQGLSMIYASERESVKWDVPRTLRMAGAGFFLSGPTLHMWFNFISRILPKRDLVSTAKKMALGQTVYGPTFTALFFSVNAILQGENATEIMARLKRDLIPTCKSGIMYWPVCDFITYRFPPVHLQPLVSNSFSLIWTIYITYMANLNKVASDPS